MQRVNVAKAVIRNSEGKYLVLRCSEWPERPDRSLKPDLPGGMVEDGESFVEGVAREVTEEAGITINPEKLELAYASSFYAHDDGKPVIRFIYFIQLKDVPEITVSWEHDKYWWMDVKEFLETEWRPYYREAFNFMQKSGLLV